MTVQRAYFLLALSLFFPSILSARQTTPPNIILINIDDLGYSDIEPFGGSTATPNLVLIAQQGKMLTSHYAAPVCSPSRAAMMTGCYPKRVLPIPGVLFPVSSVGLNPTEVTVAEVLKQAGYSTACIGKWHLGDQADFLPRRQGFDYYFGIPYSNDMGLRTEGSKSNPDKPLPEKPNNAAAAATQNDETGLRGDAQPPLPLMENENVIERVKAAQQHTFTKRYTEKAVEFIKSNQARPFFLYLAHNATHWPHYPSAEFVGKSGVSLQKDWVMEVDWSVGRVLQALADAELDKKTLVIFTSDNGGPVGQGATNRPLRGAKGSTWEGGMRVCTIARWLGKIPAGSSTDEITAHMDWLPTFAAVAGAKLPDSKLDGVDLSDLLMGNAGSKSHSHFFYFNGLALEAVRKGPWKLHLAKNELFNLSDDIAETKNLFDERAAVVEELRNLVKEMNSDLGDKGKAAPGIRTLGRVSTAAPLIENDGKVRSGADGIFKQLP